MRISEFDAWGEFVKAFGWGVRNGAAELQTCTAATGCRAASPGSNPGQFAAVPEKTEYKGPSGIAVDSVGNIYVMDLGNLRVQKFDSEGHFLLTFGGHVNKTTGANVCTAVSGNICGAGVSGVEPGEFSIENVRGALAAYVTVGPDGTVWVGDRDRIQAFNTDGTFKASISPLPAGPGNPGALAADPVSGDLYFAYAQGDIPSKPGVYRLSATGTQVGATLPVPLARAIAVDPTGVVYVASDASAVGTRSCIRRFSPAGSELGDAVDCPADQQFERRALAVGSVGTSPDDVALYAGAQRFNPGIARVDVFGATPDPEVAGDPPKASPTISEQYAMSVSGSAAVLQAAINPQFWTDTRYYVEYGTQDCQVASCQSTPVPPGQLLTKSVTRFPVATKGVFVAGLEPATTYHYRFVAESGGGGPTFGPDRAFRTAKSSTSSGPCPANEAFRTGVSRALPDCRAYEMVSPVNKNNSDVVTLLNSSEVPAARNRSAPGGDKLTFSAYKAFADPVSSPYSSQYMATRDAGSGWVAKSISPPRSGPTLLEISGLDAQFKLFDEDLCVGWFLQDTALSLDPESISGYPNLYRTDLCGGQVYEPVTRVQPPGAPVGVPPNEFVFELQGAGGDHTLFRAYAPLLSGVPSALKAKVYDYANGQLSFVCVLPNGNPVSTGCSAGTAEGFIGMEEKGNVGGAISSDGETVFWTASENGEGRLYARLGGENTVPISKGPARFRAASADGSRVLFSEAGSLYSFDMGVNAPEDGTPIAGGFVGLVGSSEDAEVSYFVSTEALDGSAVSGKPNLYRQQGSAFEFIATLTASDIRQSVPSPTEAPGRYHAARVSADGGAVAFVSNGGLTGRDSRDAKTGEPVSQVYLFDADTTTLRCVSCNETNARPQGREAAQKLKLKFSFWAAGLLPTSETQLDAPRALADDGKRVFFNSFDALVAADTNGMEDVYQWEADREGDCEDPEGCLSLISTGQNRADSEFVDASVNGDDVFIATSESLLRQDTGLIDIYDARVNGGFPSPPLPPAECEGEACQNPASPPNDPTPATAVPGPGNVKQQSSKQCAKGKHAVKRKGKWVCVKKGKKKHKGKQKKSGRAAR